VLGSLAGGLLGTRLGRALADRRQALGTVFAGLVIAVGLYVVTRGVLALVAVT
jgi:hypothetical protein